MTTTTSKLKNKPKKPGLAVVDCRDRDMDKAWAKSIKTQGELIAKDGIRAYAIVILHPDDTYSTSCHTGNRALSLLGALTKLQHQLSQQED